MLVGLTPQSTEWQPSSTKPSHYPKMARFVVGLPGPLFHPSREWPLETQFPRPAEKPPGMSQQCQFRGCIFESKIARVPGPNRENQIRPCEEMVAPRQERNSPTC